MKDRSSHARAALCAALPVVACLAAGGVVSGAEGDGAEPEHPAIAPLVGAWTGVEHIEWSTGAPEHYRTAGPWSGDAIVGFPASCKLGSACGTISYPTVPCAATLILTAIEGDTFRFKRAHVTDDGCDVAALESVQLASDGTLRYHATGYWGEGKAVLKRVIVGP